MDASNTTRVISVGIVATVLAAVLACASPTNPHMQEDPDDDPDDTPSTGMVAPPESTPALAALEPFHQPGGLPA